MDEQREQQAEATGEVADAELEQAAGGCQNNLRTRQGLLLPYIEQYNPYDSSVSLGR